MYRHRLYPLIALRLALALALLAACLPATAWAQSQSPQRVGIVPVTAVNMSEAEADALGSELGEALERELGVVVTAGAEARRRLPEGGVPEDCIADERCRSDLGTRLDADELLLLVLARVGERVQIDATWVDIASGKLASRPAVVIDGPDARAAALADAGATLLPHIQPVPAAVAAPGSDGAAAPAAALSTGPQTRAGSERHMSAGAWIAGGLGIAAVGGGLALGFKSMSELEAYEDDCKTATGTNAVAACAEDRDALARQNLIADAVAGVGAVALVAAAVLYFTSAEDAADERRAAAPRLRLDIGAERVGLSLGGRF